MSANVRARIFCGSAPLALEAAPEVEQLAVALLLARAQGFIDLWVLPSGHREGLVNAPHLGGAPML